MDANVAIVVPEAGRIELEASPMPVPAEGEVLVKTRQTLISGGTELTTLDASSTGEVWKRFAPPQRAVGYSHVGDVVAVGPGVDPSWIGQRVATQSPHVAFAAVSVKPIAGQRSGITAVPPSVSDHAATLATLAAITMNGLRRGSLVFGESVAVVGLGLLGQLATRFATFAGARPVFGVNRSSGRFRWLQRALPVTGSLEERIAAIRAGNAGQLADLVVEATGDQHAIAEALQLVRPQGRLVLLGSPRGATTVDLHDWSVWPSVTIIGAHLRSHPPPGTEALPWSIHRHVRLFLDLVASGDLVVDDLVSDVLPATSATRAYRLLADRAAPMLGMGLRWNE